MIERLLILIILVGLAGLAWRLTQRRALLLARREVVLPEIAQALSHAQAAILYFSTPSCVQCRSQQLPELQSLQQELGSVVEVVAVDAHTNPDLTSRFGIMTVPSTVDVSTELYPIFALIPTRSWRAAWTRYRRPRD
jgi:thiol-disulfide isomerase/thioredoxin